MQLSQDLNLLNVSQSNLISGYQNDPQHPQIKVFPIVYDLNSENPEELGFEVFQRLQAQLTSDIRAMNVNPDEL